MNSHYLPREIEAYWQAKWQELDVFSPDYLLGNEPQPATEQPTEKGKQTRDSYCIMIPPPNVTGTLHMGHAFQHTLIDMLIRRERMCGKPTLWQTGTDHAGIATQMLVSRRLQAQGKDPQTMGREAFLQEVASWVAESGGTIHQQMQRMGASVDWKNARFTMDKAYQQAVIEAFVRLHRDGLIYRGKRLVNWDPHLQTAVSDLEVINKEEQGVLYTVSYKLVDGSGSIDIATTRPETILADGAVAISPGDSRYVHLVGKKVWVPMTDRQIPVIEDAYVDPAFGTGCVKITPAHDFNDFSVGKRHTMEIINLFTPQAIMNENAPTAYQGLDRFAARDKIVADLQVAGQLVSQKPHLYKRPYGDRSGVVIEPYFTDQWFVSMPDLAKRARKVVEDKHITFTPVGWTKVYYNWLDNIEDWCISRQLWWGHRIPAWYDPEGNIYIGRDQQEVRYHYHLAEDLPLEQDNDVLDTWFSSALWTFATLGWPQQTPRLTMFHPTNLMVSGFDIIFFWVARMIMFTLYFTDHIPFRQVYIHGLVRDAEGQKMSKSKGNILDPLDLVDGITLDALLAKRTTNLMQPELAKSITKQTRKEFPDGIAEHGVDALRMTFCSLASTGRDIRFDMGRLEGYRNFCNKLWNATRYVDMQTEDFDNHSEYTYQLPEKWLLSKLQKTQRAAERAFATYRFDLLCTCLYEFVWHTYCDWYLEVSKPLLQQPDSQQHKTGVQRALLYTLYAILRLLHPVIPFITEELWSHLKGRIAMQESISLSIQPWPIAQPDKQDNDTEKTFDWILQLVHALRSLRGTHNISHKTAIALLIFTSDEAKTQLIGKHNDLIIRLGNLHNIGLITEVPNQPCLLSVVEGVRVLVPMQGLVETQQEKARLTQEKHRLVAEMARLEVKLHSPFVQRAPPEIVQKERNKHHNYARDLALIDEQLSYFTA